ncbi:MAG: hypothetical protein Q8K73_03910, partial [Anaerolineales bacterium]|nr:hypothetical protein [Anaerolineales bacterium]
MNTNYQLPITTYISRPKQRFLLNLSLLVLLLAGCQPKPAATDPAIIQTTAFETALAQISIPTASSPQGETQLPTEPPVPTATLPRTPPALPATYQTSILKSHDIPRTYIADTCEYLQNKWNPNNSAPGTVVMIIMFHGINKGEANGDDITVTQHNKLMNDLYEMGFGAINMQQMADFMYNNARIPQRSVLLIVDDRHFAQYFKDHFRPYYEQWGWQVVNGYIGIDERV